VEGAETLVAAADSLEADVLADERDDVCDFAYSRHVLVEDAHRVAG
jgi:hypothetical protein